MIKTAPELETAIPIYTIVNIITVPLNPYREFVNYCVEHTYPKVEHTFDLSLDDFYNSSADVKKKFCDKLQELLPNVTVNVAETTSHPKIFLEGSLLNGKETICEFKFYTHLNYISTKQISDDSHAACEIDFTANSGLDFLNISKSDHIFDFNKAYDNEHTIDMILAHLYGLANFTDFIKHFKTKSLIVKNIEMFSKKFIAPYVQDISIVYGTDEFIIGTLCGDDINKEYFKYDNYLNSVKQYAETIKSMYGEKYYQENLEKEKNKDSSTNTI
jgi:hypothetical protein